MMEKFSGMRVLVVDDEPLIRWSVGEMLTNIGHDVSEAGDARETLARLSEGPPPDIILLDYRLPDSNDLGLLERIRQIVPRSPVIMMTAYGTPAIQDGALRLGAYRVVSKPFELGELARLVDEAYASRPQ